MTRNTWIGLTLAAALMAAGCAQTPQATGFAHAADRDRALADFRAGRARLDCGIGPSCVARWMGQHDPAISQVQGDRRAYAQSALASRNWPAVVEAVMSSGFDSDITWYYLGVAAHGMGLNGPARTYLQRSIQRSRDRGGMACGQAVPCDGVALPRAAQTLLTGITPRARLAAPPAAPPAAAPEAAAPAAEPAPASNWVRPVAPTPEPGQAPSPPAVAR